MNYKISGSTESIEPTTEQVGFYLGESLGEGYSVVEGKEKAIELCKDVLFHFLNSTTNSIEKSREGEWSNWEIIIKGESAMCQKWSAMLKKAMLLSLVLFTAPVFGQSFKMCSGGVRTLVEDSFEFTPTRVVFDSVVIEDSVKKSWEGECATYSYESKDAKATVFICGETATLRADVNGCLYRIEQPIR